MIDWLTLRVGIDANVQAGCVAAFTADGEIEWRSERRLPVKGSHSETVTARRFSFDDTLEISGNPAKFLQGHNVFGTDDMPGLCRAFVRAVCNRLGHSLSGDEERLIAEGWIFLTRVDVTQSWDAGNLARALNVIRALNGGGVFAHRGRGSMTQEGTVYWRQKSRRIASKAYSKGNELKAHKLPAELVERDQVQAFADGLVRFEHTFRAMELKARKLHVLQNWSSLGVTPEGLHSELMAGLSVTDCSIPSADLEKIPTRLRLAYDAWKAGQDLRRLFSRPTFYRYRKQLLAYGIDIAALQPSEAPSNVVPLRVVIHCQPVGVPTWARGTSLYFEPDRIAA